MSKKYSNSRFSLKPIHTCFGGGGSDGPSSANNHTGTILGVRNLDPANDWNYDGVGGTPGPGHPDFGGK